MKTWATVLFVATAICAASAGTKSAGDLSACDNQIVFIDSAAENFGQYITTEILAQGLKIDVTAEADKAVCIMRATAALGGFRNDGSGSIQMIGPNGRVIWSATSGDKDSVKDLAHNLVKQLKHDLQNTNRRK